MSGENQQGKPNSQQGGGEPGILDDLKAKAGAAAAEKSDGAGVDNSGGTGEGGTGEGVSGNAGGKVLGRFDSEEALANHIASLEKKVKGFEESASSKSDEALSKLLSGKKDTDRGGDGGQPSVTDQKKSEFMEKAKKVFDSSELEILSEMLSLQSQSEVERRIGPVEQQLEEKQNQETINAIKEIPDWDKYIPEAEKMIGRGIDPMSAFQLAAAQAGGPLTKEQAEQRAEEQRILKQSSQSEHGSDVSTSGFASGDAQKGDASELEKHLGFDKGPDKKAKQFFGVV